MVLPPLSSLAKQSGGKNALEKKPVLSGSRILYHKADGLSNILPLFSVCF
jgi:hypothetical protein